MGFAVEFILDHLREIAQAFFIKKVQPTVDAIDLCLEVLRKEVVDLEGLVSAFFLALVEPTTLEISLLFMGFVDDDVVPLLLLFFSFPYLVHFMFLIALIWQV